MWRKIALLISGVAIGAIAGQLAVPRFGLPDPGYRQENAAAPRIERPCAAVSGRTAIIVVHGQSNAGNHGTVRYNAREAVDNFDPLGLEVTLNPKSPAVVTEDSADAERLSVPGRSAIAQRHATRSSHFLAREPKKQPHERLVKAALASLVSADDSRACAVRSAASASSIVFCVPAWVFRSAIARS